MLITKGASNWSQLRKAQTNANNVGLVTVTAALTDMVLSPSVQVAVGDVIVVSVKAFGTKGATGGGIIVQLLQSSGTGAIEFSSGSPSAELEEETVGALLTYRFSGTFFFNVTVAGTMVFTWRGVSSGSDWAVTAGNARIHVTVLRGS